ncbi:dihydrolipoyl dehydrogenase [Paenibacillus antri]|uniref:Dihydrolipoyl dehydrogenase n=1 Tax=Paenibacillus antri TaxID=2582848 RepID=A0A5R9GF67_9BACL|nr:dihydrolipoyl dehydrogenase [Paenibacillus antri]TLS53016.1 dihydrolipoyl dehydrogenase [Paenibacillus antri]
MTRTYDIVVLGGGPGGYVAAIRAAQLGKSVAVVEKAGLGGTCLHKGCIPSKALLRSAEVLATVRRGAEYGIEVPAAPTIDFGRVQSRKASVVEELHRGVQHLMKKHKIDVVYGKGRLMGPSIFSPQTGTIAVETPDGEAVTLVNDRLILATGSRPRVIPGLEPDGRFVLTSDEALELERLPASLAIVGGGIIGVEWASMMSDFGVAVTVLEAADRLLPTEEEDVSREMAASLAKRGVRVLTGAKVLPETLKKREIGGASEVRVEAERSGERVAVEAETLLVAVGRAPNVEGIGLESADVALERGAIRVNGFMQTSEPHIYAIGDVVGGLQMAHAASYQGIVAVEHMCGAADKPYDPSYVPRCVFSHPEVASIGLTERQAKEAGRRVKAAKMPFRAIGKALVYGEPEGFVKVVADAETNDVLGVHMIGSKVTELIGEASLARLLEATPWEIGAAIHPHPTLSEALGEAALAVDGRSVGL